MTQTNAAKLIYASLSRSSDETDLRRKNRAKSAA